MNRIDRLFGMLTLLQSRKFVPAEKLADRFGISIRTVYRDIKALNEQGIPVSFEPFKGYFVVNGFFLPPVSFTTEEANALLLMETMVGGFADKSISTHYTRALNEIRAVLKGPQKEQLEQMNNRIRFQVPSCFRYDFEYLSTLQSALSARTIIELEYKNKEGVSSRRLAEPVGLVFYALGWHLIAWCHQRLAYRDFKVPRICSIKNTGRPFTRQNHIDIAEYMQSIPVDY